MTLLALTLSVGFVVDDAIVMLENIVRHIEGGMRPFEAALKGSREIGFTIVSITFSLIAVFIPVLLMGGMVGRVFREFAVTIAVAIMISGFVSLTLTPMLCARVLQRASRGREAELRPALVRGDVQCLAARLRMGARHGAAATSRSCCWSPSRTLVGDGRSSTSSIPKGFFPAEDTGFISATTEGATDISFAAMTRAASARSPTSSARTRRSITSIRRSAPAARIRPTITGRMFIALKPREGARRKRRLQVDPAAARAPPTSCPAWSSISRRSRTSTSPAASRRANSSTRCNRATPTRCTGVAPEMRDKIAKIAGLRDVTTDLYIKNPQMAVEIDREKAAVYGISIDQIRQECSTPSARGRSATIYTPTNDYQIILESKPEFQTDIVGAVARSIVKTAEPGTASRAARSR